MRKFSAFLLIVMGLAASALAANLRAGDTSPPLLPPILYPKVNRIAFVGRDGQIYSVNPDGSDKVQVSPGDGFFTWPTWSPSAQKLVFSGVVRDNVNGPTLSLHTYDVANETSHQIFVGEQGVATLLAVGVVHYPLWSPDSKNVAFIAGTSDGLSLYMDDLTEDTDAARILDNGPLWISWSGDSDYLLVHRGIDHFLVNASDGNSVKQLGISGGGYRVPAWRPPTNTITVASLNGMNEFSLIEADVTAEGIGETRSIAVDQISPVYLWSPTGEHLALANASRVLVYQGLGLFVHQDLLLIPQNDSGESIRVEDNVLAFFWSPDGTKLAYVTLGNRRGVLSWKVMDVATQETWSLVDFIPSIDQLTMFEFFDQYSYSHSPWSPDGKSLVFAGRVDSQGVTAGATSQPAPSIVTITTDANPRTEVIATGILATWSPR